jgi:hypothetical protein
VETAAAGSGSGELHVEPGGQDEDGDDDGRDDEHLSP